MAGWPAADPAGAARVEAPRLYWIAYHSRPSTVDLDADKVAAYAEEEGLDAFLGAGSAGEPRGIRDHFARCAKALVRIGDAAPSAEG